jgi:uncharacterized protein YndB with AHSA1/START domain
MSSEARVSTTTVRDDGFAVATVIKASAEALYDAWTTKLGLEGWLATTAEVDARVHGEYVLNWPGELSARGAFVELVPATKIVLTWESWGPDGRYEDGDATVQIDLKDLGNGSTEMTQTESAASYSDKSRIEMSMRGTIQAHEALAKFIESSKP